MPDERSVDRAAYDETTRRIEDYLIQRGIPIGRDRASYDDRTRRIRAALERYEERSRLRRESS
jgi:hypothetical protein